MTTNEFINLLTRIRELFKADELTVGQFRLLQKLLAETKLVDNYVHAIAGV